VTKKSGKHEAVHFPWACNKRFRRAMCTFADNSRHQSPWAAHIYRQAITRGGDHPHVIRGDGSRLGCASIAFPNYG
jgi:hypothetical protein